MNPLVETLAARLQDVQLERTLPGLDREARKAALGLCVPKIRFDVDSGNARGKLVA